MFQAAYIDTDEFCLIICVFFPECDKISVDGRKDLYDFWGMALAESLQTDCVLNLASKEYSQAVSKHLDESVRWINFVFGEVKNEKVVEKGTLCKMARGEMVRYLAEKQIEDIEEVKHFDRLDFRYSTEHSKEDTFVYIRNEERKWNVLPKEP